MLGVVGWGFVCASEHGLDIKANAKATGSQKVKAQR
jgi:hypothetical protein